jgi:hypothetical protein
LGEIKGCVKDSGGELLGNWGLRSRWKDNINTSLREIVCENEIWKEVTQFRAQIAGFYIIYVESSGSATIVLTIR